ncbi:MAG: hypothetical protein LBQ64_03715, partial [Bacteroidales bacterium]|jgi:ferrous iron transport protein B|nr:hypothetical protein [Bacteroidales bacterium]
MELPPYRIPTWKSLFKHTWRMGKEFLLKIVTWVLGGCILIWFLNYFPRHTDNEMSALKDSIKHEINLCRDHTDFDSIKAEKEKEIVRIEYKEKKFQQDSSYLGRIGIMIMPVMKPLGFDWKLTISVFSGLFAKEIVISSLAIMHTVEIDGDDPTTDENKLRIQQSLNKTYTFPVIFSLMLFILIYFPCIATIIAIKKESKSCIALKMSSRPHSGITTELKSWGWALFVIVYSIVLAWIASFIVYQTAKLCVALFML